LGNEPEDRSDVARHSPGEPPADELRAKYLEYCSARLSEVFLSLSDEQTYGILEEAAREAGEDLASLGFQSKMRLVTARLREDVPLPTFEDWADEYRRHPERFEPMLLGLWKDAMRDAADDSEAEEG
jgi:hypothetical protein